MDAVTPTRESQAEETWMRVLRALADPTRYRMVAELAAADAGCAGGSGGDGTRWRARRTAPPQAPRRRGKDPGDAPPAYTPASAPSRRRRCPMSTTLYALACVTICWHRLAKLLPPHLLEPVGEWDGVGVSVS